MVAAMSNPKRIHQRDVWRGFSVWHDMIRRTTEGHSGKSSAYGRVSVCSEWKDFENFSKWYLDYQGQKQGFCLDKDLLGRGANIYSPATCCFLPRSINSMLMSRRKDMNTYPGVYQNHSKFLARVRCNGLRIHVGSFATPEEAYSAYLKKKTEVLQLEAVKFMSVLPSHVMQALMDYDYASTGQEA